LSGGVGLIEATVVRGLDLGWRATVELAVDAVCELNRSSRQLHGSGLNRHLTCKSAVHRLRRVAPFAEATRELAALG